MRTMTSYPSLSLHSVRDPQGHDSGRIHATRQTSAPGVLATACEPFQPFDGARAIPHAIGPTCKRCKRTLDV